MPPTIEADLMAAVNKLIADVAIQTQATTTKVSADAAVTLALNNQEAAAAALSEAQANVQANRTTLQEVAAAFSDGDDNT